MPLIGCGFTSTVFGVTTMNSIGIHAIEPAGPISSRDFEADLRRDCRASGNLDPLARHRRPGEAGRAQTELDLTGNLTVHTDKRAGPNGLKHARCRLLGT